jgi:hypothetical protein
MITHFARHNEECIAGASPLVQSGVSPAPRTSTDKNQGKEGATKRQKNGVFSEGSTGRSEGSIKRQKNGGPSGLAVGASNGLGEPNKPGTREDLMKIDREGRERKATKADDAQVPEYL